MMDDLGTKLPRRRFVDWLMGMTAGGRVLSTLYPVLRYLIPPEVAEASVSSVTLPVQESDLAPQLWGYLQLRRQARNRPPDPRW